MSRLKQLGKDSLIYGIGGILAKGVSFLLLPVYTRIFTPSDYGTIEMLTVISSFLATILVMGMDSAQSMYFFKHKEEGKSAQARIVSAILQWRLIWGSIIVIIATLSAPLLNAALFNGKLVWEYFAVAFVGTLFAQIMSQSAEVMRLIYHPLGYIGITLSQSLLAAALILTAVLGFDQGIFGYFLGTALASIAVALLGWYKIREYIRFDRLHVDWWPQLLRFGAPLVPASLATYFMSTSDRWFIQYYHGQDALGIFSVGAKFTMLMTFAVETFRKAWWPIAMDAMNNTDGPETFRVIARLYMGLASAGLVGLTAISPWLVKWLVGPAFKDAWPIVGVMSVQVVIYGFFSIASAGIWKAEKIYLDTYIISMAAIVNLLFSWMLVPTYGAMGAALATVFSFLLCIIASLYVSESLWKVSYPLWILTGQISLASLFIYWFIVFSSNHEIVITIILAIVIIILLFLSSAKWSAIRKITNI